MARPTFPMWGPADRRSLTAIEGGVTTPAGFRAAAGSAGLKASGRPDVAVVVADAPAQVAVAVTTNQARAAVCDVAAEHGVHTARAVVINAGNANACTPEGRAHALATCETAAATLKTTSDQIIPMSTGIIGVPLPITKLQDALPEVLRRASAETSSGDAAAHAIMTTDLAPKQVAYRVHDEHGTCTVAGMAKGSGMIEPAMATMLGVITTDAPIPSTILATLIRKAVAKTFNRISVDGSGSTNDTVAILASGAADTPPSLQSLTAAVDAVCADLAMAIVRDGEGVTRVARLAVGSARSEDDAVALARAIASSALFRAALHGGDPNWGRILAAMGASPVRFEPSRVSVSVGGVTVCRFGVATAFDVAQASNAMARPTVDIVVELGLGDHQATFLVGDLSKDYVTINAEYTT